MEEIRNGPANCPELKLVLAISSASSNSARANNPLVTRVMEEHSPKILPNRSGVVLRSSATYFVAATPIPIAAILAIMIAVLRMIENSPNSSNPNSLAAITEEAK